VPSDAFASALNGFEDARPTTEPDQDQGGEDVPHWRRLVRAGELPLQQEDEGVRQVVGEEQIRLSPDVEEGSGR
jgi:hypothetical protein